MPTSDNLEDEGGGWKQVRKGRHPIMDSMSVEVVPNDIFASPGQRLHVLTGQHLYIIIGPASKFLFVCL
jgi:hypothetical protein